MNVTKEKEKERERESVQWTKNYLRVESVSRDGFG
jgi:hypothetical protein